MDQLLAFFQSQVSKITAKLKPAIHASGPKKPTMSQQESKNG